MGWDYEETGEEIGRDAVSCDEILCSANRAFAAVRGEDYDWRDGAFESAVEVGEALDVEHMYLEIVSENQEKASQS